MRQMICAVTILALLSASQLACTTSPQTRTDRQILVDDSNSALRTFEREDSSMKNFVSKAFAYVVFPSVGKGAVGVGGAYGRGIVYQGGKMIGYADMKQATVGVALGGQEYRELICFEDAMSLDKFKANNLAFAAQASAVAVKSGASADAKYADGVAVFTMPTGGLMFEASVGGQQFTYISQEDAGS
jgi:lipid-binding SYLF domain-containing protein